MNAMKLNFLHSFLTKYPCTNIETIFERWKLIYHLRYLNLFSFNTSRFWLFSSSASSLINGERNKYTSCRVKEHFSSVRGGIPFSNREECILVPLRLASPASYGSFNGAFDIALSPSSPSLGRTYVSQDSCKLHYDISSRKARHISRVRELLTA